MCPSNTTSLRCFFSYCDAWSFHLGPPGKLKQTDIFHFYIIGSFQDSDSLFCFRRSALNYIVSSVKDWDSIGANFFRGLEEGSAYCSLHLPIHAFYFLSNLTYMPVPIQVSWFVNLFFLLPSCRVLLDSQTGQVFHRCSLFYTTQVGVHFLDWTFLPFNCYSDLSLIYALHNHSRPLFLFPSCRTSTTMQDQFQHNELKAFSGEDILRMWLNASYIHSA